MQAIVAVELGQFMFGDILESGVQQAIWNRLEIQWGTDLFFD